MTQVVRNPRRGRRQCKVHPMRQRLERIADARRHDRLRGKVQEICPTAPVRDK